MKAEIHGDTLCVSSVKELGAANANAFRDWVRKAVSDRQKNIDIDLSETTFIDSCGLGALVALHKTACSKKGLLRLLRPQTGVLQIIELARLDRVFQVVKQ
ncbi:MAG TPA: STAS domain-containing protein [Verrucomicrobiae bacterium]|nr:STAS domain-containing protein [Verrucomicrobiae bacterium]